MVRATALKRALIFVHRWLGVALSGIFFLWFASGIVMMYWSYPTVTTRDRLKRAPVLDPTRIRVAVDAAYGMLGRELPPAQVRLASFDGRPVYRFGTGSLESDRSGAAGQMVFADDGLVVAADDEAMIDRAATRWAGQPIRAARKEEVTEVDQWTVGDLRNLRPLFKYSWPDGQQVYANGRTAEVVQVHNQEIAILGVPRGCSALAVFHPVEETPPPMVFLCRLVVPHRHDDPRFRHHCHRLDVPHLARSIVRRTRRRAFPIAVGSDGMRSPDCSSVSSRRPGRSVVCCRWDRFRSLTH